MVLFEDKAFLEWPVFRSLRQDTGGKRTMVNAMALKQYDIRWTVFATDRRA